MRILNILCGIAVLLLTLHFAHLLHHLSLHAAHIGPHSWALMILAIIIGILSFIGGCLLLRCGR